MKSIFDYIDYRRFLADYYATRKQESAAFSYRFFAQKAGIKSPVFLKQVIEGDRNLTDTMCERFMSALKLSDKQARYFSSLVKFNQARTSHQKQECYALLRSMMNRINERVLAPELYDYFDKWYNPVLRELFCMVKFDGDFKTIAKMVVPAITPAQAKKSLTLLLNLGLVQEVEPGRYMQNDKALGTGSEVISLAVRSFNREMIARAGEAVERFPLDRRHASGITLTCTPELYKAINAEIDAFKDRIVTLVNNSAEPHTQVCQLNVQLFPVSDVANGHSLLPGGRT
ncbi:MAG: TIGR02147 family protein [Chitinivibrionales bacterium]|nr:TIGR02147 family protein [Chitinivibrionales bacterium]